MLPLLPCCRRRDDDARRGLRSATHVSTHRRHLQHAPQDGTHRRTPCSSGVHALQHASQDGTHRRSFQDVAAAAVLPPP